MSTLKGRRAITSVEVIGTTEIYLEFCLRQAHLHRKHFSIRKQGLKSFANIFTTFIVIIDEKANYFYRSNYPQIAYFS